MRDITELKDLADKMFAGSSVNWKPEPRFQIKKNRIEVIEKYNSDIKPKLSFDDRQRLLSEFYRINSKGKRFKGILRLPSEPILIIGETGLGKTYLLKTFMAYCKDRQEQGTRIRKVIAKQSHYSDEGRLKRNRFAQGAIHNYAFTYLSENDFRNYAVKKNDYEIDLILDRFQDKSLKYIFLDELFYKSNWNFDGYYSHAEGYFKQLWDTILDARHSGKIIVGTTNNNPNGKEVVNVAVIQRRITETFTKQIVLEGKK